MLFFSPRHFLFKPGGTSPMYCTTSPGYPLTSSTVYSPPPRPLPRNTFSRPAFSLKKPYKHCNWKCAALSAILISVTLLFLLAYFIGESPLILLQYKPGWVLLPFCPSSILPLNCRHRMIKCSFVFSLSFLIQLLFLFFFFFIQDCFIISLNNAKHCVISPKFRYRRTCEWTAQVMLFLKIRDLIVNCVPNATVLTF